MSIIMVMMMILVMMTNDDDDHEGDNVPGDDANQSEVHISTP